MRILVDSNILMRLVNPGDPQRQLARDAFDKLLHRKDDLCLVPQCCYEFWVVATRPTMVNGLGFSASQASNELSHFKQACMLLDETPVFFSEWEKLVAAHAVVGKNAHDTRLVAAMTVHGITHLLTFNKQDFQRFTTITARTPADVMAAP